MTSLSSATHTKAHKHTHPAAHLLHPSTQPPTYQEAPQQRQWRVWEELKPALAPVGEQCGQGLKGRLCLGPKQLHKGEGKVRQEANLTCSGVVTQGCVAGGGGRKAGGELKTRCTLLSKPLCARC